MSRKRLVVSLSQAVRPEGDLLSPLPLLLDTSLHCKTTDMRLVHRVVCLFMPHHLLVIIVPIHGWMARLS